QGGRSESLASLRVSALTGATNDINPANNSDSRNLPLIDAVDDAQVLIAASGGRLPLLANDRLNGRLILASQASLSLLNNGGLGGLVIDAASGEVVVPAGVAVGSYSLSYQLCVAPLGASPVCDTAQAAFQVQPADIAARLSGLPTQAGPNQPYSATLTCSSSGPAAALAASCSLAGATLGACTVGGLAVSQSPAQPLASLAAGSSIVCAITGTAPANGRLNLVATAAASNDSQPANNIDRASLDVIDAVDDGPVNLGQAGGSLPLLDNDSLAGSPVVAAQLRTTLLDLGGLTGARLDPASQRLLVPAGSTPGSYTLQYQICTLAAPQACDSAFARITVDGAPDLVVSKSHSPALYTEGNLGRYTIVASNQGNRATSGPYTVVDTLPAGMTLDSLPTGNGWNCTASLLGGSTATCSSSTVLAPGQSAPPISLGVKVAQGACTSPDATGTCAGSAALVNRVSLSGGGEPADKTGNNRYDDPTPVQQSGSISGQVWLDSNHDRLFNGSELPRPGLKVEVLDAGGTVVGSALTQGGGNYQVDGLVPGTGYSVRFMDPATGAYYGRPVSRDPAGGNDPTAASGTGVVAGPVIQGLSVPAGNQVRTQQSLPLDPSGLVYDSDTRQPLGGAVIELVDDSTGTLVPAACVVGGANRIVSASGGATPAGSYSFLLNVPVPAGCPGAAVYRLKVTPPAGYASSSLLKALDGPLTAPGDCINNGGVLCQVQRQASVPVGAEDTRYFLRMRLDPLAGPDVVNNHIPLDATGKTALAITKVGDRGTVEIGESMSYTITVRRTDTTALTLRALEVIDTLPLGLSYIPGTAQYRIGSLATFQRLAEPTVSQGLQLRFNLGVATPLASGTAVELRYRVRVGVGAEQGTGINRAQATTQPGGQCGSQASDVCSGEARHHVRITSGVFGLEACVIGKVYVDCNHNHVQDAEELGIPGVRLYREDGSFFITDVEGKYSACGLASRLGVLVVDPSTLPRGSRLMVSANRNAGDAASLFLDLKSGELHRADFIEGSCSNRVMEQVKARRQRGEVNAVDTVPATGPVLKFDSKPTFAPPRATDCARQLGSPAGDCGTRPAGTASPGSAPASSPVAPASPTAPAAQGAQP
ncbi:MAG: hypothetical protein RL722_1108, partial [Pseudomonadota bacterium]